MNSFNLYIYNSLNYEINFISFADTSPGSSWSVSTKIIPFMAVMKITALVPPSNTLQALIKFSINNIEYDFLVLNKQQKEAGESVFALDINKMFTSEIIQEVRNPIYPNILQFKEAYVEISAC
jgi:hypothetical protein